MRKNVFLAVVPFSLLFLSFSCASIYRSYRDKLNEKYQEAQQLYNQNRLLEALDEFEDIKGIDPDYRGAAYRVEEIKGRLNYLRESYYAAGVQQQKYGQALNAILSFQTCLSFSPGHSHRDARSRVSELLKHPQVVAAIKGYLTQAKALRSVKNFQGARQQYMLALRVDPDLSEANSGIKDIDRSLRSEAEPMNAEGEKFLKAGNYTLAVTRFQQALATYPQYTEAAVNLERASALARNEQGYQAALSAANSGNSTGCLSALSRIQGYHPLAAALQNRCREDFLKNIDQYFQQAVSLYQQQKLEESLALFRWILAVRPDHEEAAKYAELAEKKLSTLRQMEGK